MLKALWQPLASVRSLPFGGTEMRHHDQTRALFKCSPAPLVVRPVVIHILVPSRWRRNLLELDHGRPCNARVQAAHDAECAHKCCRLLLRPRLSRRPLLRHGSEAVRRDESRARVGVKINGQTVAFVVRVCSTARILPEQRTLAGRAVCREVEPHSSKHITKWTVSETREQTHHEMQVRRMRRAEDAIARTRDGLV